MNDIREIKCEACPRVCPEDYQKMVEKYSRACQERDRANEMLQKGQEKHRWIPVTERLPKLIPCRAGTAYSEAVNVLTSDRKVITAIWDGTDWIGPFGFWDAEGKEITHWTPVLLPLPEPPKAALKGCEG